MKVRVVDLCMVEFSLTYQHEVPAKKGECGYECHKYGQRDHSYIEDQPGAALSQ